jgi:hypothetical protein
VIWLRIKCADCFIPIPIALDVKTVIIQMTTAIAMTKVIGVVVLKRF